MVWLYAFALLAGCGGDHGDNHDTMLNTAPEAQDDQATTTANTPVTIDVLANDTDADGDMLTVVAVSQGTHGAVSIQAAQSVQYTPDAGFQGSDRFTYTLSDSRGETALATVSLTVTPEGLFLDTGAPFFPLPDEASTVAIADLNGDGVFDLVTNSIGGGVVLLAREQVALRSPRR